VGMTRYLPMPLSMILLQVLTAGVGPSRSRSKHRHVRSLAKAATGAENRLRIGYNQGFTTDCNCRGGVAPRLCRLEGPAYRIRVDLGSFIAAP
jgi:hypothetical protein